MKFQVAPYALAAAVLAGTGTAMIAAPAYATTSADCSEGTSPPIAAPYSEEEIQRLQLLGDFLGANSRITANRYALGHAY